jgi:hypothetical protein
MAAPSEVDPDEGKRQRSRGLPQPEERRRRALEACTSLNQIISDMIIANRVLRDYETIGREGTRPHSTWRQLSQDENINLFRMCISHEVLSLCLFEELVEGYGDVIPRDLKTIARAIIGAMRVRKVKEFRHIVVAHVFDEHGMWTPSSEINDRLNRDLEMGEPGSFSAWISTWPGEGDGSPRVLQRMEQIRDQLAAAYGISRSELKRALSH